MTEQKFTKGPWTIRKSESKQAYNVVGTKLGGKWKIARCPATVYNMPDLDEKGMIEAKANALLMSKSPELLQMLKESLDYIYTGTSSARYFIDKVKDLINQATTL